MLAVLDDKNLQDIANAIRSKGIDGTFTPSEMSNAILSIEQMNIGVSYCDPPSASLTATFDVLGEPKWFTMMMILTATSGTDSSGRCVACIYDGNQIMGMNSKRNLTYSDSYYSYTYSNGKLEVKSVSASNGGYMHHDASKNVYMLIYGY